MKRKLKLNYFNPSCQKLSFSPISSLYSCAGRKLALLKWLGLFYFFISHLLAGLGGRFFFFCRRHTCILVVLILLDMENVHTQKKLETYFSLTNLDRAQIVEKHNYVVKKVNKIHMKKYGPLVKSISTLPTLHYGITQKMIVETGKC